MMRNDDLTFPLILGMDFMRSSGIILDFSKEVYILPFKKGGEDRVHRFSSNGDPPLPHLLFYLAVFSDLVVPSLAHSTEANQLVQHLVQAADTSPENKSVLQRMMEEWPTVCTTDIGHTKVVKHSIITHY